MFKRVLVTAQEINKSITPLEKGIRLCDEAGTVQWFLTVYHPAFESAIKDDPDTELEARALYERHRQEQIERLVATSKLKDSIKVQTRWHPGFLEAAFDQAERYLPDLVVVPRLPTEDLVDWLLGGDEPDLVRKIKDPLLLASANVWPEHPRICVAVDPFHLDNRNESFEIQLVKLADQLSRQLDGELHLVHCFHSLPQSAIFDEQIITDYEQLQKRVGEEHRKRIENLLVTIDRPLDHPLMHLIEGDVTLKLPEFCRDEQIDLLILGCNEHSVLERLLMGSTTERLLSKIPQDVLVIHSSY